MNQRLKFKEAIPEAGYAKYLSDMSVSKDLTHRVIGE